MPLKYRTKLDADEGKRGGLFLPDRIDIIQGTHAAGLTAVANLTLGPLRTPAGAIVSSCVEPGRRQSYSDKSYGLFVYPRARITSRDLTISRSQLAEPRLTVAHS